MTRDLLDRFRQPAYTGENRCLPCTAVNVAIAAVLTVAVTVTIGYGVGTTAAAIAGAVTGLLSVATIALRGYLVPGTPQLTKAYLPDRVRQRFGKRPAGVDDGADLELAMKGVGAVPDADDAGDATADEEHAETDAADGDR